MNVNVSHDVFRPAALGPLGYWLLSRNACTTSVSPTLYPKKTSGQGREALGNQALGPFSILVCSSCLSTKIEVDITSVPLSIPSPSALRSHLHLVLLFLARTGYLNDLTSVLVD